MATVAEKTQPSPLFRWAVLLFISMAMFGNYYVYDSISPLADLLKAQLGFSDSNLGLLNAIYSFPNIIMVLIGGIIIDRIGAKKASVLFSSLCMIGSAMTTFSGGDLVFMAAGRLVFDVDLQANAGAASATQGLVRCLRQGNAFVFWRLGRYFLGGRLFELWLFLVHPGGGWHSGAAARLRAGRGG